MFGWLWIIIVTLLQGWVLFLQLYPTKKANSHLSLHGPTSSDPIDRLTNHKKAHHTNLIANLIRQVMNPGILRLYYQV